MATRLISVITLLLSILLSSSAIASTKKTIKVYTYHDKPPYVINEANTHNIQSGIYLELVSYLNRFDKVNQYSLSYMPRVRLESLLKEERLKGIVIGVNPLWFGDKQRKKYLWSEAFMDDKDIFLVNSNSSLDYKQTDDLVGLTIALERGTYYKGVTELIKQEKMTLAATNSSQQNLNMVAHHRADITIMSQLTANYFFNHGYQRSLFKIFPQAHDHFQRFILIPKSMKQLSQPINHALKSLNKTSDWLVQFDDWLAYNDYLVD